MAAWAAVAVAAYSAYSSSEAAGSAQSSADAYQAQQIALERDKWSYYKENILPLEMEAKELGIDAQQLALQRGEKDLQLYMDYYAPAQEMMIQGAMEGIDPQYERARREAATDVNTNFEAMQGVADRDKSRMGLRPGSGRYEATDRGLDMTKAATRAGAMTGATERERDRVEGVNFNRLMAATGRQPGAYAPTQGAPSPNMPGGLSQAYGAGANYYGNMAQTYRQNIGQSVAAGLDLWDRFSASSPSPSTSTPYTAVPGSTGPEYGYADGGLVDPAMKTTGYAAGGEVSGAPGLDRVPAVIDGNQPAKLTSGEYVIPKEVVQAKGTEFFDKLLESYTNGQPRSTGQGLTVR